MVNFECNIIYFHFGNDGKTYFINFTKLIVFFRQKTNILKNLEE